MPACSNASTHKLTSSSSWSSLVERSISSWDSLSLQTNNSNPDCVEERGWTADLLRRYSCLDDFLRPSPSNSINLVCWFFQRRESFLTQTRMTKWDPDALDNYILLPAVRWFVNRQDCFFVSHYWESPDHPDPDGKYLRLLQDDLRVQEWSYIWVDWTCIPQAPRNPAEEVYFRRSLKTVSGIIRNSGFVWYYPPFEARLWILYEVAEYMLTGPKGGLHTEDAQEFMSHVIEMVKTGVREVLDKYNYRCTYDHDRIFLISWLELLVLMKRLKFDVDDMRSLLDSIIWHPTLKIIMRRSSMGLLILEKCNGILRVKDKFWRFTPFPAQTVITGVSREMQHAICSAQPSKVDQIKTPPRPGSACQNTELNNIVIRLVSILLSLAVWLFALRNFMFD